MGRNTDTDRGSDWIGSVSLWIGLDWIQQNGPMSNSDLIHGFLRCEVVIVLNLNLLSLLH